jgi:hypothetical protein
LDNSYFERSRARKTHSKKEATAIMSYAWHISPFFGARPVGSKYDQYNQKERFESHFRGLLTTLSVGA